MSGRHATRRELPLWARALVVASIGFGAVAAGAGAGVVFPEDGPLDPGSPPVLVSPAIGCRDSASTWEGRTWWSCAPSPTTPPPSSTRTSSTPRVEVTTTTRR